MDLIAQGPQRRDRWRRPLPQIPSGIEAGLADDPIGNVASGEWSVVLGRAAYPWEVPWDDRISRRHVVITAIGARKFHVQRLPDAKNPVFFRG
ncbi:MAG: hypothetical protein AAFN70_05625, partial [Planctomycetota bacterium]